jgi:hypothetical protein
MIYDDQSWIVRLVLLVAVLASAAVTFGLIRLKADSTIAVLVGGIAPGVALFLGTLYLDGRSAEGILYLWLGLVLAPLAIFFGIGVATAIAILCARLRGTDRR